MSERRNEPPTYGAETEYTYEQNPDRPPNRGGVPLMFSSFPGGAMGFVAVLIFALAIGVLYARRKL